MSKKPPVLELSTNEDDKSSNEESQSTIVERLARNVRLIAEAQRFNGSALADALEIPNSTGYTYWSGKRAWPVEYLPKLADTLGVSANELLNIGSAETSENQMSIPMLDLSYGMGGSFVDGYVEEKFELFPRSMIRSYTRAPAEMLCWAEGIGDSMAPTIHDSDLLLIDRSQEALRINDKIWALAEGNIGMVKRLRVRDGQLLIMSDNESVADYAVGLDEVQIIGQVVAKMGRL